MKLKLLRLQYGYTCKQVAEILQISENTYRRYEKNPWSIRADKLALILRLFKVKSIDILDELDLK